MTKCPDLSPKDLQVGDILLCDSVTHTITIVGINKHNIYYRRSDHWDKELVTNGFRDWYKLVTPLAKLL